MAGEADQSVEINVEAPEVEAEEEAEAIAPAVVAVPEPAGDRVANLEHEIRELQGTISRLDGRSENAGEIAELRQEIQELKAELGRHPTREEMEAAHTENTAVVAEPEPHIDPDQLEPPIEDMNEHGGPARVKWHFLGGGE